MIGRLSWSDRALRAADVSARGRAFDREPQPDTHRTDMTSSKDQHDEDAAREARIRFLEEERDRRRAHLRAQEEEVQRLRAERAALEKSVRAKEAAAARRRDGH